MKLKLPVLWMVCLLAPAVLLAKEEIPPRAEGKEVVARLEVIKAKLNGYFIDIRLRIHGRLNNRKISEDYPKNVYVIEESTGEKFFARKFSRIGNLGQKHLDEGLISSVRIENVGMKIRKNSRVTLVLGELRQEHIIVED